MRRTLIILIMLMLLLQNLTINLSPTFHSGTITKGNKLVHFKTHTSLIERTAVDLSNARSLKIFHTTSTNDLTGKRRISVYLQGEFIKNGITYFQDPIVSDIPFKADGLVHLIVYNNSSASTFVRFSSLCEMNIVNLYVLESMQNTLSWVSISNYSYVSNKDNEEINLVYRESYLNITFDLPSGYYYFFEIKVYNCYKYEFNGSCEICNYAPLIIKLVQNDQEILSKRIFASPGIVRITLEKYLNDGKYSLILSTPKYDIDRDGVEEGFKISFCMIADSSNGDAMELSLYSRNSPSEQYTSYTYSYDIGLRFVYSPKRSYSFANTMSGLIRSFEIDAWAMVPMKVCLDFETEFSDGAGPIATKTVSSYNRVGYWFTVNVNKDTADWWGDVSSDGTVEIGNTIYSYISSISDIQLFDYDPGTYAIFKLKVMKEGTDVLPMSEIEYEYIRCNLRYGDVPLHGSTTLEATLTTEDLMNEAFEVNAYYVVDVKFCYSVIINVDGGANFGNGGSFAEFQVSDSLTSWLINLTWSFNSSIIPSDFDIVNACLIIDSDNKFTITSINAGGYSLPYCFKNNDLVLNISDLDDFFRSRKATILISGVDKKRIISNHTEIVITASGIEAPANAYYFLTSDRFSFFINPNVTANSGFILFNESDWKWINRTQITNAKFNVGNYRIYAFADNGKMLLRINLLKEFRVDEIVIENPRIIVYPEKTVGEWSVSSTASYTDKLVLISNGEGKITISNLFEDNQIKINELELSGRILTLSTSILAKMKITKKSSVNTNLFIQIKLTKNEETYAAIEREYNIQTDSVINLELSLGNMNILKPIRAGFYNLTINIKASSSMQRELTSILLIDCDENIYGRIIETGGTNDNVTYALIIAEGNEISAWLLEDIPLISEMYQGAITNQSGVFIPWNQTCNKYNDVNIKVLASDFDGISSVKAYCNGTELPSSAADTFFLDTKEQDEGKTYNITIIVEDYSGVKAIYTRFLKVIPYAPRILAVYCNSTNLNNAVLGLNTNAEIQFEEWGSGVKSITVLITNDSTNISVPITIDRNIAAFEIPTMNLLNGIHRIYVIIKDNAGLSSFKVLTITTDRTPPEIHAVLDLTGDLIIGYISFFDEHLDKSSITINTSYSMTWINSTTAYVEIYMNPIELLFTEKSFVISVADIDSFGRRKFSLLPINLIISGIIVGEDNKLYATNQTINLSITALGFTIIFKDTKYSYQNYSKLSIPWNVKEYQDGETIDTKLYLIDGSSNATIKMNIIKDTAIPDFYTFNISGGVMYGNDMYFNYQNLTIEVSVVDSAGNLLIVTIYANNTWLVNFTYDGGWSYTLNNWANALIELNYNGDNYWLNATIIYNASLIQEATYKFKIYACDTSDQYRTSYAQNINYACADRTPPKLLGINIVPLPNRGCHGEFANFSVFGGTWNITSVNVSDNFGVKLIQLITYDCLLNKSLRRASGTPENFYWVFDTLENIYSDTFVLVKFIIIDYAGNKAIYRYYLCIENRGAPVIVYANNSEIGGQGIGGQPVWLEDIRGHNIIKLAMWLCYGENRSWVKAFYVYLNRTLIVNITVLPDYTLFIYNSVSLISIDYDDYAHLCKLLYGHFYGINTNWFNVSITLNETYLVAGTYNLTVWRISNHESGKVVFLFKYRPRTVLRIVNTKTWITNPWIAFNVTDVLGRPLNGELNITINETNRWGIIDVVAGFVNVTLNGTYGTLKVLEIGNYTLVVKYLGDGIDVEKAFKILVWEWNPPNLDDIRIMSNHGESEIDGTDHGVVIVKASDNETYVESVYLNYTVDGGVTWNVINMTYNGTHWNATLPAFKWNTNVTFRIYIIDHAGNVFVSKYYSYVVVDPYPPIIWTINNTKNTYTFEEINITAMILENINGSGFGTILMDLYISDDNITWSYIGTFELKYGSNPRNVSYGTYIGEYEEWNNATIYWISIRFDYATYVKVVVHAYDRAGNEDAKEHYFRVRRRGVKIIAWNITTRYGDNASIEFQVIDRLNGSLVKLYYEIWLYTYYPVKLLACGYSNASGNTTVYLVFNEVKVIKLLIKVVETDAFNEAEKIIYVNVTREIMKVHASVSDVEKDNTFHLTARITDDEGEIVIGGSYQLYIYLSNWIKIKDGEFSSGLIDEDIKLRMKISNGNYTIKLLVFADNYENATVIMTLEVSQTIFKAIKLNETKLGKELYVEFIVNDPDGIQNVSVKLMNAYGEMVDANVTIENINTTAKLIKVSKFLDVHDCPGKWRIRLIVIDSSNTRTEKMFFVNVRDVELRMKLITPENKSNVNSTVVKIVVYIWYEETRPATNNDITSISATVINEGIIESLKYNGTPGYFECMLTLSSGSHMVKVHAVDASKREVSLILNITILVRQGENATTNQTSNQTGLPQSLTGESSLILIISLVITLIVMITSIFVLIRRGFLRKTRITTNVRRI